MLPLCPNRRLAYVRLFGYVIVARVGAFHGRRCKKVLALTRLFCSRLLGGESSQRAIGVLSPALLAG
jgi:hypothetical protein